MEELYLYCAYLLAKQLSELISQSWFSIISQSLTTCDNAGADMFVIHQTIIKAQITYLLIVS